MKKKNIIIILIFSLMITLIFMIPTITKAKDVIYKEPTVNTSGTDKDGLDDMIKDAEDFEKREIEDKNLVLVDDPGKLSDFSSSLYTILVVAGTAVTVIIGVVLGVKYMVGSVDEKAEYKKMLLPYLAGCIAIYGSLGIWQLAIKILGNI